MMKSLIDPTEEIHKSWHDSSLRWVALGLACIMQMGNYFCYDFPAVLEDQIRDQFGVSEFQYNLLYTVYSTPNVILPLCGGVLIDYIGIRKGIVLFSIPLIIGQGICILGSWTNTYYLLIIGRIVYGIGGENMSVVQSSIVSKWFAGKEMAFALGYFTVNYLQLGIGSIMNSAITPKVYDINKNISLSLIVGFLFLLVSWVSCIILAVMDKKSDERDKASAEIGVEIEKISLKDCKEFKIDLAMVVFSCMVCYTNLFVLQQNDISMFKALYKLSDDNANVMYQIPYYQGAALTPFMGLLIDKIGQRPLLLIISGFLLISVDVWYMLMPSCSDACYLVPVAGQIVLGIFYTFYAAVLWPTVPLCVPEKAVGTAFGVTNSVQNMGLALGPLAVGWIVSGASEDYYKYREMMMFFLAIAACAQLNNIALKIYDTKVLRGKLSWSQLQTNSNKVDPSLPQEKSENISMNPYD